MQQHHRTMSASPRVKILCLHGFTSNGAVHAHQVRRLTNALPEYEFIFPDGPHKVDVSSYLDISKPDNRLWTDTVNSHSNSGHRAWWFARESKDNTTGSFHGLETSLEYIADLIREKGPFHGIWGFSQGGCFAGILCALMQQESVTHSLRRYLPSTLTAPVAGIVFSGFRARFPQYDEIYDHSIKIPTMHIMGAGDTDVINQRSEELIQICTKSVVLKHDGGHNIPKGIEDQARILEFIRVNLPPNNGHPPPASI